MTESEALNALLVAADAMFKAEDDPMDEYIARADVFRELVQEIKEERDALLKEATTPATNDWRDVARDLFLEGDYDSAIDLIRKEAA